MEGYNKMRKEEVKVIRRLLEHPEVKIRRSGYKKVVDFLTKRPEATVKEYVILWKGIIYTIWLADKPVQQHEFSLRASKLLRSAPDSRLFDWISTFYLELQKQWILIDRTRLDKFFRLLRIFQIEILKFVAQCDWDRTKIRQFNKFLLNRGPLSCQNAGVGIALHFCSTFLETFKHLKSTSGENFKLSNRQMLLLLVPFLKIARQSDNIILTKAVHMVVLRNVQDETISLNYFLAAIKRVINCKLMKAKNLKFFKETALQLENRLEAAQSSPSSDFSGKNRSVSEETKKKKDSIGQLVVRSKNIKKEKVSKSPSNENTEESGILQPMSLFIRTNNSKAVPMAVEREATKLKAKSEASLADKGLTKHSSILKATKTEKRLKKPVKKEAASKLNVKPISDDLQQESDGFSCLEPNLSCSGKSSIKIQPIRSVSFDLNKISIAPFKKSQPPISLAARSKRVKGKLASLSNSPFPATGNGKRMPPALKPSIKSFRRQ